MVADQLRPLRLAKPCRPGLSRLKTLVAAARAWPGRLTYVTDGITSIPHLTMEQWTGAAAVEFTHVAFHADAAVMTEVFIGRLDVSWIVLGSAAERGCAHSRSVQ